MHDYKAIDCPICHNQRTEELFRTKDRLAIGPAGDMMFGIRKCPACQIVFAFPFLSYEEVRKFYPEYYFWKEDYKSQSKLIGLLKKIDGLYFKFLYNRDVKNLTKFIGNNKSMKLLDIGCGDGIRLEFLKKNGFLQCSGVEFLENEARYAREVKKLDVINAAFNEFDGKENDFDVVTLYNVFEHFNNPIESLKKMGKILKPGGWLVMEIPNFNSWQMKLFKAEWVDFDVPRHYFFYTEKTMREILTKNGFQIKTIDWTGNFFHPFSWVFSFPSMDPEIVWQKEERHEQTIFHRIWWGILLIISIIPNAIETVFGKGGHMTIYAINQKKYENSVNQSSQRL